ncbi:MAG: hypothetical protein SNJ76_05195 [Fimbriimonadaceae bacterium]
MGTLAALAIAATLSSGAADFFPLAPGTRWVYQERTDRQVNTYTDEVGAAVEIDGKPAFPVVSTQDGRRVDTIHYRVEGDTVLIVAYDPRRPLSNPRPVLKVGRGRTTWRWEGGTPLLGADVPLKMSGSSQIVGRRDVLGVEREVLEVKLEGELQVLPDQTARISQTALYARGVGLFEMRSRQTSGSRRSESVLRLVSFRPAPTSDESAMLTGAGH